LNQSFNYVETQIREEDGQLEGDLPTPEGINHSSVTGGVITRRGVATSSERVNKYVRNQMSKTFITPEQAANVVKEYILPMFENDGKRLLKKK